MTHRHDTPTNARLQPSPGAKPRRRRPTRTFAPEVLTNDEVLALIDACPTYGPGLRNRALLAVLYRSGLRLSEALSLRPKDVDPAAGQVAVLRGKGGRWRFVGIDAGALAHVATWAAVRDTWKIPPTAPLFCSKYGSPLTTAYVRRVLPDLARKAGILHRVHAHGLRHTMAAQLRSEGVDIAIISRQLGHRSISTTAAYLDHLAPLAVVEAMRKRSWTLEE